MDFYSPTKMQGKKWFIFYLIYCINLILLILLILTFQPYWAVINYTFSSWINVYLDIVFLLVIIPLFSLFLGVGLLGFSYIKLLKNGGLKPKNIFLYIPVILLVGSNLLIIIFLYQLGDLIALIPRTLEFFSFYLFFVILFCFIFLFFPLIKFVFRYKIMHKGKDILNKKSFKATIVCIIFLYLFVFISPLIFIPSNVLTYTLPQKPSIIAHRGVSSLAPENTIKAGELTLDYSNVIGWEVDIQISYDGIPFLMHDDTLLRTTNVEDVFPTKINLRSSEFNISELLQLDAGSWYVEQDPFGMIRTGGINNSITDIYKGVAIPTLEEALNFSRDNNLFIDFDIKAPHQSHPFYGKTFEIIIDVLLYSEISQEKVFIPTLNSEWIDVINTKAPNIILGWQGSPNFNEYQEASYEFDYINSDDVYSNQDYRDLYQNNIQTIIYTVESPIRYYQLWYLGATWIKTNSPQNFEYIDEPIVAMDFPVYLSFWIVIYLIALSTLCLLVYKYRKELNKSLSRFNKKEKIKS